MAYPWDTNESRADALWSTGRFITRLTHRPSALEQRIPTLERRMQA